MSSEQALARWQASIGSGAEQPKQNTSTGQRKSESIGAPIGGSAASALEWRNKTVLLVDHNLRSRESRAKAMRNKGVQVDCVANADAARLRLAAGKYNLILVDLGRDTEIAESLVQEIRSKDSRQLVRFLVGSPLFVAKSLSGAVKRHAPAPALVASADLGSETASPDSDFGQNIRAAEAEETA